MKCAFEPCNEVAPDGSKYHARACKDKAFRARKKGTAPATAESPRPEAVSGEVAKVVKVRRKSKSRSLKRPKAHARVIAKPSSDGMCRWCERKKAKHGRGIYCSDECRVKAARNGYIVRQKKLAKA